MHSDKLHPIRKTFIFCIRLYQWSISPMMKPSCRFSPTCSSYAIQAIETHGIIKGSYLTLRRLAKCHPFSKHHGYDPVPSKSSDT